MAAIAASLRANGMYKPILVHRPTMDIIAGNHTWKAAKKLGWDQVSVTFTDVSEKEALAILLSDNRASDMSVLDEDAVFAIASALSSLEGTGYTAEDLRAPDLDLEEPEPAVKPAAPEPKPKDEGPLPFRIGSAKGLLDRAEFAQWRSQWKTARACRDAVWEMLGFDVPEPAAPENIQADCEAVPIKDLRPYPGNPNQGDVGLLIELLRAHGQTRPIVASSRTKCILAGNHVALAAQELGWKRIGVTWVDVDPEGERRIVLADNRTSQLAGYDSAALGAAIAELGLDGIAGSGFSLEDLDDVVNGRPVKQQSRTRSEVRFAVGPITGKVPLRHVEALCLTPGLELAELASMLGIDPAKVAQGPQRVA